MLLYRWALCSALTALFLALATYGVRAQSPTTAPHFVGTAALDSTAAPGDNFYRYANGLWMKQTMIPPEGYRSALTELNTQNDSLLNDLVRAVIAGRYNHTQAGRLLYSFYRSGIDSLLSP